MACLTFTAWFWQTGRKERKELWEAVGHKHSTNSMETKISVIGSLGANATFVLFFFLLFFWNSCGQKPLQSIVQQQVKLIGRGSGAALRAVNHSLQPRGRERDDDVSRETLNTAWARRRRHRNIWSDWLFAVSRVQSRRRCFFHRRQQAETEAVSV